ncbi:hypothetical protein HPB51_028144 [Rhipicephalus microplus]|uniref:Uncharacterized protein n=1 Tax=Rhipicephalus microplus TaxID=6941 RepID=A0A9J6CY54_RHIMP|nr:hypothetical protein HPB51_028144 [Rhipicephalus microplus]
MTMRRIATTKTTGTERETLMTSHPDQERQSRAGAKLSQMLTEVVRGVLVERRGVQGTIGCEMVVVGTSGSSVVHHHLKISKKRIVVVLHGISTEKIVAAKSLVETLGMTAVVGTLDEPESLEMIALPGLGKVRTGVLGSRNPEVVGLAGSQMINVHHHEKITLLAPGETKKAGQTSQMPVRMAGRQSTKSSAQILTGPWRGQAILVPEEARKQQARLNKPDDDRK